MNILEQSYSLWLTIPVGILIVVAVIFAFAWLAHRKSRGQIKKTQGEPASASSGDKSLSQFIKDKGGDPEAAWPILIMWPVVLFSLRALFPSTWNDFTRTGILIATVLVAIYAASRMWSKKSVDRFATILFIVGVLMVALHEKPIWSGVAEKTRTVARDLTGSYKTPSIERTIHRILKPGEQTTVEIPYGYAFDFSCDVPGLITSPRRVSCVPKGDVRLGNSVSRITFQALDQELRVSVRLTPAS